jgi:hypothetical protein
MKNLRERFFLTSGIFWMGTTLHLPLPRSTGYYSGNDQLGLSAVIMQDRAAGQSRVE